MSDTVVNDPADAGTPADTTGFFLDGDAPRLSATPTIAPPPGGRSEPMTPSMPTIQNLPADAPTLPAVSPVLSSPATTLLPSASTSADHSDSTDGSSEAVETEPEHPMAHLMPTKSAPTEASRRAAEIRAARKAKSKKIKIGVVAGMLVFSAVVGPPLGKWLVDAINEAGDTTTVEEPAE